MIHYHGTPCSGKDTDAEEFLAGRHALIPWRSEQHLAVAAEVCQSFCFDNGAFTAWKSGEPITDWSGYYAWVEHWRRHPSFEWAIIPDVIDGDEAGNDALIAEWPLGVFAGVPVWHLHESLERLERLSHQWPRVALGSSGAWPTPGTRGWNRRMHEAMAVLCENGRPRCKLHGLRMLDPAIFHLWPLSSADSTNAVRNSSNLKRFGIYTPPSSGARMATIARRTEAHQSAAVWVQDAQKELHYELENTPCL